MHPAAVGRSLGLLLLCLAAALLVPAAAAVAFGSPDLPAFLLSAAVTAGVGLLLVLACPGPHDLSSRDGFAVVALAWVFFAAFGALPYWFAGTFPAYTDAFFEAMSGFTTTGATVMTDIEVHPPGILLWRSFTQWLGGMGIIVLSLAVLPALGVGAVHLFRAEVPGPTHDRLVPRVRETAKLLWLVYIILSAAEVLLLRLGGMDLLEAVHHTFTTMATGGFSVKNASIAAYPSPFLQWVITAFMFIAGANFVLHFHALRGNLLSYWRDPEFRFYTAVALTATALAAWATGGGERGPEATFRGAAFNVVSILTTTGYVTADYERWPAFAQLLLLFLMFVGGCAGSTGGAMKNVRVLLLFKNAHRELHKLVHPKAVRLVRLGGRVVPEEVLHSVQAFALFYVLVFVLAAAAMTALGFDLVSAAGAVATTLGNVGPGLGSVGPTDHYAGVPFLGKWILAACMLVGRLELYTVLILFLPDFWEGVIGSGKGPGAGRISA
jgi:trk system potassium uptake protein TrkH